MMAQDGLHACAAWEAWENETFSERFDSLGADGMPARLGLYGGSFDPIHNGHIECALAAARACNLNGVVLIPAGVSPFKRQGSSALTADRLAMCELAVRDNPTLDVSAIEAERGNVSYTVRTLEAIRARYADNVQLYFIIGSDSLAKLDEWYEAKRLAELATFVAVSRPGASASSRRIRELEEFGFTIVDVYDESAVDISSHEIREMIAAGEDVSMWVGEDVARYIQERGLYGSSF